MLLRHHLSAPLTDGQNSQHGVDSGHLREDTGVGNSDVLEAPDLQLVVHDRKLVLADITHLGGTSRVVHRVRYSTTILAEVLVGLDVWARRHLALEPRLEGFFLCDLARGFEARDDGGGVVALWVCEVAEVEGGLDVGVGGGEVELASRAGARDVGGHAEGVLWLVVA